jgi:hypothetical protein
VLCSFVEQMHAFFAVSPLFAASHRRRRSWYWW